MRLCGTYSALSKTVKSEAALLPCFWDYTHGVLLMVMCFPLLLYLCRMRKFVD